MAITKVANLLSENKSTHVSTEDHAKAEQKANRKRLTNIKGKSDII